MWSKTKWLLEQRLADCLKGRVSYNYAVYSTKNKRYRNCYTYMHVMCIHVDGQVWFATNPNYYYEKCIRVNQIMKNRPKEANYNEWQEKADYEEMISVIRDTGYVMTGNGGILCDEDAVKFVHDYLNVLSFEECINSENYFIRLLALLDKRLGKRRLKRIIDNIDNEPELFKKWIKLRDAE